MKKSTLHFSALADIEEKSLLARLEAVRKTISHSGEKGRALENELCNLLRAFLPSEYGLSTGFVAYRSSKGVKLSSQLDIIVYDALRCGPIARLGSCDVFPLEAVYAYIEVKSSLQSSSDRTGKYADNSIERCILNNKTIRALRRRYYFQPVSGSITESVCRPTIWMPLRAYIFAFESTGKVASNPELMAKRISEFSRKTKDVHLHGVFVGGSAYYTTIAVDPRIAKPKDFNHVKFVKTGILSEFKWSLLHDLSRFPRFPDNWTPAVNKYHMAKRRWQTHPPGSKIEKRDVYDV